MISFYKDIDILKYFGKDGPIKDVNQIAINDKMLKELESNVFKNCLTSNNEIYKNKTKKARRSTASFDFFGYSPKRDNRLKDYIIELTMEVKDGEERKEI